jgi:putative cell wall-binding protein
VVKGLQVSLTAAGTGVVKINASTGAVANIGGAAQTAIGVLNQSRIGGIDRYATSAQLFTSGGATTTAVVAGGLGFADGLSANYLAGQLGTGTLLTDPASLPQPTKQALFTTGVATVYILGGTTAVGANVANQIGALHVGNVPTAALINVIRIAGADRYATNNAVDLYLGAGSASGATAYVASGNGFADALTIGPASYDQGNPLVLVNGTATTLTPAAQSTIVNLGITKVIIVGGTAVVTPAIEAAIHTATGATVLNRLAGADRTLTAAAIAAYETTSGAGGIAASGTYVDVAGLAFAAARVYLTNGLGYADALSAGPVAGSNTNAILLTGGTTLGAGIPSYFAGKAATVNNVVALGLTGVLPVSIVNAAIASLS